VTLDSAADCKATSRADWAKENWCTNNCKIGWNKSVYENCKPSVTGSTRWCVCEEVQYECACEYGFVRENGDGKCVKELKNCGSGVGGSKVGFEL
jgi:hypothetical protein